MLYPTTFGEKDQPSCDYPKTSLVLYNSVSHEKPEGHLSLG